MVGKEEAGQRLSLAIHLHLLTLLVRGVISVASYSGGPKITKLAFLSLSPRDLAMAQGCSYRKDIWLIGRVEVEVAQLALLHGGFDPRRAEAVRRRDGG